jgi:hypothetical protein
MDLQPLLTQRFDSAMPTGLSTLVHPFSRPGQWQLEGCTGDAVRVRIALSVREATPGDAGEPVVVIDAGELAAGQLRARWSVTSAGLVGVVGGVLQVSGGKPRRRGLDWLRLAGGERGMEWSSVALHEGDVFALVPFRPGRYAVHDIGTGQRGALRVRYPDPRVPNPDVVPLRPDDAFATAMELACGQGLVLRARQGSRFIVELEEADDGPADLREWQARHDRERRAGKNG